MYALNDNDFLNYDAQIGINIRESGEYTVRAKAVDMVGNESEEVSYTVSVDMVAPTGDVAFVGEAKSDEYEALTPTEVTEEPATEEEPVTEEVVAPVATPETVVAPEVPAGTEVDVVTE
jgi:hypothetical protein